MQHTNVEKTYIKETNEEEPCAYVIKTRTMREANWLDRMWGHKKGELIMVSEGFDSLNEYILVVPEGTIQMDYNITVD